MENVMQDQELEKLGVKTIKKHKDLNWLNESDVRIGYVLSDKEKKGNSKITFADCNRVQPIYRAYIEYDFIIRFYEPNVMMLDDKQKEILMYHELLHIGIKENGDTYIVPHDIEDFSKVLSEYGLDWNLPKGGEVDAT